MYAVLRDRVDVEIILYMYIIILYTSYYTYIHNGTFDDILSPYRNTVVLPKSSYNTLTHAQTRSGQQYKYLATLFRYTIIIYIGVCSILYQTCFTGQSLDDEKQWENNNWKL